MKKTKRATQLLAIGALASLTLVAAPARAQDPAAPVSAVRFGMMGAVQGEIVRLNVSNPSVPVGTTLPPPCRATLSLVDIHGDTLLRPDGTPVSRTVNLLAGHSAFLQIHANPFIEPDQLRLDFRPLVVVEPSDSIYPPPCVPSLELIVAATGVTRLVNVGVERMGRPDSNNHNETLVRDRY